MQYQLHLRVTEQLLPAYKSVMSQMLATSVPTLSTSQMRKNCWIQRT